MDLGIAGRWALACTASKGWGLGCARASVSEGIKVVIVARGRDALEQAADALRALPGAGEVRSAVADIATPQVRTDALAACPQVDIMINNTGGPPRGDFRQWEREDWLRALDAKLPGQFATDRLRGNFAALAQQQSSTAEDVAERKRAGIPARRFGEPDEFSAACAFLCSAQAAYIRGHNLLIDGGSYPGTF
ncbi:SDR family oxidoreductase [Xanthomonas fragariae]|uniref:SDR family oxidoreductase n=1 Tax=Xanthomonas fragariae TaxID=48664 RepID=UPI0022AA6559|nr:SDR family oxidoreductase [Xanthomonas fragariae]WAT14779.1 SDR family oxidoreductase [Xanthomonas fragariae]